MTKEDLVKFENEIKALWENGTIKAPDLFQKLPNNKRPVKYG